MGGAAQEAKLPAVAAAPFADEQVQPQADAFGGGQRMVNGPGLRPRGFAAVGREVRAA